MLDRTGMGTYWSPLACIVFTPPAIGMFTGPSQEQMPGFKSLTLPITLCTFGYA